MKGHLPVGREVGYAACGTLCSDVKGGVPVLLLSSLIAVDCLGGLVVLAGFDHGEDDVAAAAGEADDSGVVLLAFGSLAVVEGSGVGRAERCERGEEHGVFESVVASSRLGLAADRLPGLSGHGCEPGVGSEFVAGREPVGVADLREDAAPVRGPIPGIDRSTSAKGWDLNTSSICSASLALRS